MRILGFRSTRPKQGWMIIVAISTLALLRHPAVAQGPTVRYGTEVPSNVRVIYERGLKYLATSQQEDGSWGGGGQLGAGVTGLCLMAFLAHGDDPNFGPYAIQVRRAVRNILTNQNQNTGYIGNSMYHHGFATLALAEAYGAVDESLLWGTSTRGYRGAKDHSIAKGLELAVRCALTSQQKNPMGAWRYSPDARDADTSVAGAVLMGLLAARNAGIEVPDASVDKALEYYRGSTSDTGMVAYSGGIGGMGESMNRSAVATLVYAIGKKKDWKEYRATLAHIVTRLDQQSGMGHPFYFRYYMAQALFQGDVDAWKRWERENVEYLTNLQSADGSFSGSHGPPYATAMSLLSLALEYRFLPIYER